MQAIGLARRLAVVALAGVAGCATMTTQSRDTGAREPGIVLASSHLTANGDLRIVARIETGPHRMASASIAYTVSDPAREAPLAAPTEAEEIDLLRPTIENADIDRNDAEISFTLGRRALAELGERCLWYRWSVHLDGNRVLRSAVYRTSRGEAGLPRAAQVAGPDTSFALPPAPSDRR